MPEVSERMNPFEIGHRIHMTVEVKLHTLHVIQFSQQMVILEKCGVFFRSHVDFACAFHNLCNNRELLLNIRNLLMDNSVFLTAFSQAHNNVAVDFRESILQPGSKINICVTHDYNCNARVYTKMNAGLKSMGSPDLLVLFTSTISHTMVRCALRETRGEHVRVARSHTSSMAALRGILERHIVQEEA